MLLLKGTINYMAPEVIASSKSKPYDSRAADMWGCGVLLYAMLLMRYPFKVSLLGGRCSRSPTCAVRAFSPNQAQHVVLGRLDMWPPSP